MPKRTSKRARGGRPPIAPEEVLNKPLTIHFDANGLLLITQAARLDDDVRANWARRQLLRLARERIAAETPPDGASTVRPPESPRAKK